MVGVAGSRRKAEKAGRQVEERNPGGRPSLYRAEYVDRGYELALLGLTDQALAKCFEINPDTLYEWQKAHPEFREALLRGKELADRRVADALYQRALGYSHYSVKIFNHEGAPLVVPFIEHYAPDVTACIFWLKNRQPARWRDKQHVEHEGDAVVLPEGFMEKVRKYARDRNSREKAQKAQNGKGAK
ncbi:MAG: helix-turn-helix domain-containing protein [Patescibacteria group bacterium]|nr:helix-turn-helix domain-containing protein [Patescibacteria group bacterium]